MKWLLDKRSNTVVGISITRPLGFSVLFTVFSIGFLLNFFLTPNPYSANHSGDAARWADVHSITWVLHAGMFMALAILSALFLRGRRISLRKPALLFLVMISMWMLASGIVSTAIWIFPHTYVFITFTFVGVAIVGFNDVKKTCEFNGRRFFQLVLVLYAIGVLMAIVRPGIWGWVPFQFSRAVRGEITLASILALPLLLGTGFVAFKRSRTFVLGLVTVLLMVVEFSFVTRRTMWLISFPFFIGTVFFVIREYLIPSHLRKVSVVFVTGGFVLVFLCIALGVVFVLGQDDLIVFLNARLTLWHWHWSLFLQEPFWGSGVFPLLRFPGYSGSADSEVGVLAAFSQFGIGFGLFQVGLVFRAIIRSVSTWLYRTDNEFDKFSGLVVLTMVPVWVFGGSWRILNAYDLVFWYCVFYMNFSRIYFPR